MKKKTLFSLIATSAVVLNSWGMDSSLVRTKSEKKNTRDKHIARNNSELTLSQYDNDQNQKLQDVVKTFDSKLKEFDKNNNPKDQTNLLIDMVWHAGEIYKESPENKRIKDLKRAYSNLLEGNQNTVSQSTYGMLFDKLKNIENYTPYQIVKEAYLKKIENEKKDKEIDQKTELLACENQLIEDQITKTINQLDKLKENQKAINLDKTELLQTKAFIGIGSEYLTALQMTHFKALTLQLVQKKEALSLSNETIITTQKNMEASKDPVARTELKVRISNQEKCVTTLTTEIKELEAEQKKIETRISGRSTWTDFIPASLKKEK